MACKHLKAHGPEALRMGRGLDEERERALPEGVDHSLALHGVMDATTKVGRVGRGALHTSRTYATLSLGRQPARSM